MSVEFHREAPGKFDSRTLNRKTLNRWTGRTGVCEKKLLSRPAGLRGHLLQGPAASLFLMFICLLVLFVFVSFRFNPYLCDFLVFLVLLFFVEAGTSVYCRFLASFLLFIDFLRFKDLAASLRKRRPHTL